MVVVCLITLSTGLFSLIRQKSVKSVRNNLAPTSNIVNNYSNRSVVIGLPLRLKIPSLKIDAAVESVGLTPDQLMDVPKSLDNVGWFQLGRRPGETGSAVIAGHFGLKENRALVFDNLHKVGVGDKIYIIDDQGITITFVVREIREFEATANTTEVFSSSDALAHLNLITCQGTWDKASKSYDKRLVVFADKE